MQGAHWVSRSASASLPTHLLRLNVSGGPQTPPQALARKLPLHLQAGRRGALPLHQPVQELLLLAGGGGGGGRRHGGGSHATASALAAGSPMARACGVATLQGLASLLRRAERLDRGWSCRQGLHALLRYAQHCVSMENTLKAPGSAMVHGRPAG